MQLDSFRLQARARNPWEAMDLGIVILRDSLPQIAIATLLAFSIPLTIIAIFFRDHPDWALYLIWWLKPLYDRFYLAVFGAQVFGGRLDLRDQVRGISRVLSSGLFASLTLLRLDPVRSYNLPVYVLERLKGKARWDRSSILNRAYRGHAASLTLAGLHFETVLVLGFWGLILLLAPENVDLSLDDVFYAEEVGGWTSWIPVVMYLIAVMVIEPLYVASGFALYLNRRIDLEGWDIEIRFRQMASRLAGGAAVLILAIGVAPSVGHTQDDGPLTRVDVAEARQTVDSVYAMEEFSGENVTTSWKWRGDTPEPAEPDAETVSEWSRFFERTGETLAAAFKVIVVIVLVLVALWIYRSGKLVSWFRPSDPDTLPPAEVAGLDIRRESLPDDVAAAARQLMKDGDRIGALSLLYRGALSVLVHRDQIEIDQSSTEGEVVRRVKRAKMACAGYFGSLTSTWTRTAYGHREVSEGDLAQLIDAFETSVLTGTT